MPDVGAGGTQGGTGPGPKEAWPMRAGSIRAQGQPSEDPLGICPLHPRSAQVGPCVGLLICIRLPPAHLSGDIVKGKSLTTTLLLQLSWDKSGSRNAGSLVVRLFGFHA